MPSDGRELIHRYSDLFVDCNDGDVQKLYWLLSLFFAKCDGLISNPEVQRRMGDPGQVPFDPYFTPVYRKDSILIRLKFLKKYNISSPSEIIRVLTWGLFKTERLSPSDRAYLAEFTENPDKPFSWFAERLGVTSSSVFEAYRRLNDKIQFRFISALNFPLLKLKHFVVFFKPKEGFDSTLLSREFTFSINRDTFGDWMWASFLVPNQRRILNEFNDSLRKLSREAFSDQRVYEVKSMGRSCNLSMFDGESWVYSEAALGVGAFKFAERGEGVSPRLHELKYGEKPIKFDRVDFLISTLRYGNARLRNSEIRKVLTQYGYDLSWVTLSKRLTSLRRAGVFLTSFYFAGLGLNFASTIVVECDDPLVETLFHAFPQFPECTAYKTDKGVIFVVRVPAEGAPAVTYLVESGFHDKANRIIVANRFENIGSRTLTGLYRYWNNDKQFWEFKQGTFDLTRKPQE